MTDSSIDTDQPGLAIIADGPLGPGFFARVFVGSADAFAGIAIAMEDRLASRILVQPQAIGPLVTFAAQACETLATALRVPDGEAQISLGRSGPLPGHAGEVIAWATPGEKMPQLALQLGSWDGRQWRPASADPSVCSIRMPLDDVPAFAAVIEEAVAAMEEVEEIRALESGSAGRLN